ncbi:MAG: filamentous hemagglutinin N-terminal domain-containing protein, partial [Prochlorothrix sp.]|nr:filamentous hemagglutinin N-terminal domain-containing protein [Prochlorothrix sp.]
MGNLCSATTLFVPATVVSLLTLTGPLVLAQPIVPNADGTGTQVTQSGNQIDITGGTMAGSNQFHSFEQFNVPTDNTANFVTPAHTDNVLGRVNGGSASIIDGTVRVTGSDANLYLMNPSGVVFGENARLDVPGSFNATSATGIGVGDGEFSATGQNNYGSLVGAPNSFNFDQPTGAVVNHGDLAVSEGKSLNLVGTTVENRGSLSAPGGSVNVIAVPGAGDRVRIEQAGMVLNLEVANDNTAITPTSLPKRLTGGDLDHANTLEVGPDGVARLTTRPSAAPGTAVVSGTAGNPARINADRVQVTGGQVIVENAAISATGNQTQVLLQATQGAAAVSNSTANLANLAGIGGLLRIRGAGVAVEQSQIRLTGSTTGQVQIESRAQGAALGTALSGLEDGITAEIAVGNTTIADSQISVELGADIGATGPIVTGQVDILGPGQVLIASSDIAANQVRIGGDFQGQGEVVTAQDTIVDASSTISTLLSPFAAHANLPLSSDSPQSPSANPG